MSVPSTMRVPSAISEVARVRRRRGLSTTDGRLSSRDDVVKNVKERGATRG